MKREEGGGEMNDAGEEEDVRSRLPTRLPIRHRNLPMLLLMARESMIAHFRPILNRHGLTEQQWRILRVLVESGELEQRLIADSCQILGPSLAGILSRMEDVGLIERRKAPNDQRRVLVSASPRAHALAVEMSPLIEEQYARFEAIMGKPFIDEMYGMLDRLLTYRDKPGE